MDNYKFSFCKRDAEVYLELCEELHSILSKMVNMNERVHTGDQLKYNRRELGRITLLLESGLSAPLEKYIAASDKSEK